jgi:septal ring factor EnvC (AmiA/AmiB activator)
MNTRPDACPAHATRKDVPETRAALTAQLAVIDDDIAAIRNQLAAADMERQSTRKPIDARWFHRAKTALRHLQQDRREALARFVDLPKPKDRLKDIIIAEARARLSPEAWQALLDAAHARREGGCA